MQHLLSLAAFFGTSKRRAHSRTLTADATIRRVTLPPGAYRIHGSAQQTYLQVRAAADVAGTLAEGNAAPTAAEMVASVAGTPAAGLAWDTSNGSVQGGLPLPSTAAAYELLVVPDEGFLNVYVQAPGGATTVLLEGPFE